MNLSNCPRMDYGLKRSFISDNFQHQANTSRTSLIKRSSFTGTHEYSTPIEHPKTPKANPNIPFSIENHSIASHYYHQSNYGNHHQYPVQQVFQPIGVPVGQGFHPSGNRMEISSSRIEPCVNKIEAFTLEDKKLKELGIEDRLKQITQKLEITMAQVQKHESMLKSQQRPPSPQPPQASQIAKLLQQTLIEHQKQKQIETTLHTNLLKTQIESIKAQLSTLADRSEVEDRIGKIGATINKTIQSVNRDLMEHLNAMTEMHARNRRKELDRVRLDLETQIGAIERSWEERVKKDKDDYEKLTDCSSYETLPSRKVFLGDPILLKFISKVSITIKSSTKQLEDQQTVYKVDNEGYLLDSEGRYILNSKYQQIRLSQEQLDLVRDKGFLK